MSMCFWGHIKFLEATGGNWHPQSSTGKPLIGCRWTSYPIKKTVRLINYRHNKLLIKTIDYIFLRYVQAVRGGFRFLFHYGSLCSSVLTQIDHQYQNSYYARETFKKWNNFWAICPSRKPIISLPSLSLSPSPFCTLSFSINLLKVLIF